MVSKLHKRVRRLLKEVLGSVIQEEVNVQKLFPDYPVRDQHYDLVIPSYNLVIECHGEQHRNITTFGEKDTEEAAVTLERQKQRDRRKEEIVWENGWGYIAVWYDELPKDETIAKETIKSKVQDAIGKIDNE